jgi:hypothetical protein
MKGDENLAEVQLSHTSFDALTGVRVADRVDGKSEAFSVRDEFLGVCCTMPG